MSICNFYKRRLTFAAREAGCPLDHCMSNYHVEIRHGKVFHVGEETECRCGDRAIIGNKDSSSNKDCNDDYYTSQC